MMINILLDECLPKRLKFRIKELDPDFSVKTVPEAGWASISNGKLLEKAKQEFDVFVTSDRNLSFQQTIETAKIHVILLKATTYIYEDLLPLVEKISPAIKAHKPGQFVAIEYSVAVTQAISGF